MNEKIRGLIDEAKQLDLFKPTGAFEVHCSNCHARLDPLGDCPSCGLLGRSAEDVQKRAQLGADKVEKQLSEAIARRKAYKPVGRG